MTPLPEKLAPPGDDDGVVFPLVEGRRSTTATGRAVLADAAGVVDPALASDIRGEDDWRKGYVRAFRRLVEAELAAPGGSVEVPRAGLGSLHRRFEFVRDGEASPLATACADRTAGTVGTATVTGLAPRPDRELAVPFGGGRLRGEGLRRQLAAWEEAGTIEPSCRQAVEAVIADPSLLDLSDVTVVVLGAGAEMGPVEALAAWGATVVAVDLPQPRLWTRVLDTVRGGAGRAIVPVRHPLAAGADDRAIAAAAGVDLVREMPEVAAWLAELEGPLTLGNYVYADGAMNVRVAMAVDALADYLTARRDDVSLAVLATATDVFAVGKEVVDDAVRRFAAQPRLSATRLVHRLSLGRAFAPNYATPAPSAGGLHGIADAIIPQQGPNYALAKRLQRWRARHARHDGLVSSINVAPPTRTRSVLKNRMLAAAYDGAPTFGIETFDAATSRTLMAAMLAHDLRHPRASAQPDAALDHPLDLLVEGANHGGLWRNPFAPRTVLPFAVGLGVLPWRG